MIAARLSQSLDLLGDAADILSSRVTTPEPPAWCTSRGWEGFLLALDDEALTHAEHVGLAAVVAARNDAPASLCSFIAAARTLSDVEESPPVRREAKPTHRASRRKDAQIQALATLAAEVFPRPTRIVDVGAGHGHLTRALAQALGTPAVGLDRDRSRVQTAQSWNVEGTSFERWDGECAPLRIGPGELAVGLHACGDLGDLLVTRAVETRANVLLVSCCLQKIRGDARAPLSAVGKARSFIVPQRLLGLANLSTRPIGVEASMPRIMGARRTRYALRLLLASRGVVLAPGDEARGINRRRMGHGLASVADQALSDRGLPAATSAELASMDAQAALDFARIRRLSLPRAPLGRVLERAIVFDRAAALEEAGHETRIVIAFEAGESPRNLAILGRVDA